MPDEKDFYKDIIDNLYDGIYFVDRDRVITYWNKGAERITGYPAAQTIGRGCQCSSAPPLCEMAKAISSALSSHSAVIPV